MVRAVTFDYWNTIVRADADQASHRRRAWQAEYASAGHAVDDEVLHAAFRSVWSRHHEAWLRNEQLTGEQAANQAVGLIGLPVDEPTRRRLVERFLTVGEVAGFRLC